MDLVLARQPGGVVAPADERLGRGVELHGGQIGTDPGHRAGRGHRVVPQRTIWPVAPQAQSPSTGRDGHR